MGGDTWGVILRLATDYSAHRCMVRINSLAPPAVRRWKASWTPRNDGMCPGCRIAARGGKAEEYDERDDSFMLDEEGPVVEPIRRKKKPR